jgi:hypothetical protein
MDKKINKYNKLILYKDGLNKFISSQNLNNWKKVKINLQSKLIDLDYVIGILFLTETNRNCKNNNINIHGYYITCGLINLFYNIKQKLLSGKKISNETIIYLFNSIANNVEYLNSRTDSGSQVRRKINENYANLLVEITPYLNDIVYFKKKHKNMSNPELGTGLTVWEVSTELNDNNEYLGSCNKNCYSCWVDEILTKFFYILLLIAKFMGTGIYKDPNLYKLAEYYSNIIFTTLKLDNVDNTDNMMIYQNLFGNYQDYKTKLIYSNMELGISSETIDNVINYLDDDIINKFLSKKITK